MEYLAVYKFSAKISQRLIGLRLKMADRQGAGCSFLVAWYWLPTYALLRRASTYVKTSVDRSVGKLVAGCRLLGAGYWLLPARRPTTSIKHDFVGLKSLFFTCPTKYRCCLSVRSWSVGEPARRSLLYSVGEPARRSLLYSVGEGACCWVLVTCCWLPRQKASGQAGY